MKSWVSLYHVLSFLSVMLSTPTLHQFINYNSGFSTPVLVSTEISALACWDFLHLPICLSSFGKNSLPCGLTSLRNLRAVDFSICYLFSGQCGNFQAFYMGNRKWDHINF